MPDNYLIPEQGGVDPVP